MVSTKGYWDMINEHINKSDLEYLESKEVIRQRKELKKNWLGKDELYQFEIAQMQKQIQNLYIRIKELNEEIYEFPEAIEDLSNELLLENNHRFVDGEDDSLLYGEDEFIELNNNNVFAPEENKIRKFS